MCHTDYNQISTTSLLIVLFEKSLNHKLIIILDNETGLKAIKFYQMSNAQNKSSGKSFVGQSTVINHALFSFLSIFGVRVRDNPTFELFSVRTQPMTQDEGIKCLV